MRRDNESFEVVVVGGGPAGVTAALRASELGATVALVERGNMGGTCTNDGCVPTRVLAKAARLARDAQQFADYGLEGEPPTVDFARLLNRAQHVVYAVHEKKQLRGQLEAVGVRVFERTGGARFDGPHTLALAGGESVQAERFILCAGGRAPDILPWQRARHYPQRRLVAEEAAALGSGGGWRGDGVPAGLGLRGVRRRGVAARRRAEHPGAGG